MVSRRSSWLRPHQLLQPGTQLGRPVRVEDPVPFDDGSRWRLVQGQTDPPQLAATYDAPHRDVRRRRAVEPSEDGRPGRRCAAPIQSRWQRVEHLDAPDGPAPGIAQERPVTDSERQRMLGGQAEQPGRQRTRVHTHVRRADVQHRTLRHVRVAPDAYVDDAARHEGARRQQHLTAADRLGHAGRRGSAPPGRLHSPDHERTPSDSSPRTRTRRSPTAKRVPDRHGPVGKRAGDDGPAAADVEGPVDPEPHVGGRVGCGQPRRARWPAPSRSSSRPCPVRALTATVGDVRQGRPRQLGAGSPQGGAGVGEVARG